MESIIKYKFEIFIENHNIIRDSQHGFHKGRSCLTNLLAFFEEATKCFDCSRAYDIVYVDFQKAFDKVPHESLITKMKTVAITGGISEWVQNWLQDRTQRVVVGEEAYPSRGLWEAESHKDQYWDHRSSLFT